MKYIPWLVFACSLTLLLLANFVTYSIQGYDCRGLPFVYERSRTWLDFLGLGLNDFFRPIVLAIDMAIAIVISALVGLLASRFNRIQRGPRTVFMLAVLAYATANVLFIYYEPSTPSAVSDFNYQHFFAPYSYYVMLVPSVVLTISGLVWSLLTARMRRSELAAAAH